MIFGDFFFFFFFFFVVGRAGTLFTIPEDNIKSND